MNIQIDSSVPQSLDAVHVIEYEGIFLMRTMHHDVTAILLLLVSGLGCATFPQKADSPLIEGGPGETLKRLTTLMQTPSEPRPAGAPTAATPAPSSIGDGGPGAYFKHLLTKMETPRSGSVPSPEPPPAVPSAPPPATAMAPSPPPAKSEAVARPPLPTVVPSPPKEEARPRERTPSPAIRVETAALAPAPLAAEDPSKGGSAPSPEPPPAVPSTPPASDSIRPKEEPLLATKSYRIGPEDVVNVSVWDNPELTMDVTVRPDGKISFPLIKEIQAADFTPMELSDVIARNLKEYIKNPHVTVIVTQAYSKKVFLVGNVLRPGSYPLRHDMTLLQALSLAGGFTTFASPRDMKLIRGTGTRQESRSINYYKMIEDIELDYYKLKPGDTIVIP
jgi:polysaccharide export outer membrane protein